MLGFHRQRSGRPLHPRRPVGARLEALEARELLTGGSGQYFNPYYVDHAAGVVAEGSPNLYYTHPNSTDPASLVNTGTSGKTVTGRDRQGNNYTIRVTGPGYVVVTDATPQDGVLDDDINTITIVGSDINTTKVVGTTSASASVVNSGQVLFNHLYAANGVNSIQLNGFSLSRTVGPTGTDANNTGIEVNLPGGVRYLSFHNILAPIDVSTADQPIDVVIGQAGRNLSVSPTIKLDAIFNTNFDSTQAANLNGIPSSSPGVNITVNGTIRTLEFLAAVNSPTQGGLEYTFPNAGTTGRTAIRAQAIDHLRVIGTARNVTASRGAQPFQQGGFGGLTHLGNATFGGTADAVGLDVNGPIHNLKFIRGLGDPTGSGVSAQDYGIPDPSRGVASFGGLGGLVTSTSIHSVTAGPATHLLVTDTDPNFIQVARPGTHRTGRQGSTVFYNLAGNALTSAAITSSGSIGKVHIVGSSQQSEIKTGFHYPSYAAGLEGTRSASHIGRYIQKGALIDSVVSASYRPGFNKPLGYGIYGSTTTTGASGDVAGPGRITGTQTGGLYSTGSQTALGQRGVGVYARTKVGKLPPA